MSIQNFLESVQHRPSTETVFNPWKDYDPQNDLDMNAPRYRFDHLTRYMTERKSSAKMLLVAEATGYQGAKRSGLAMSSERDLLRTNGELQITESKYFSGEKYRTSKVRLPSRKSLLEGSIEPTATIVWNTMTSLMGSHDFVLWNSFAWHSHIAGDMLTNRTPTDDELESGKPTLELFLQTFAGRPVVAVGRKAETILTQFGVPHYPVRHPANGGATKFRNGIEELLQNMPLTFPQNL